MDFLPESDSMSTWLIHYGSFTLFILLTLGIIALPVPEETLMVIAGTLMSNGTLGIFPTIAAAVAGSLCGITISYLIGRTLGSYFLTQYGAWLGLTEERFQRAHTWFERYGKWTLVFGYFIPGVRHFTGLSAGITNLKFRQFALFAYSGAILWDSVFLSIGYFFHGYWASIYEGLEISLTEVAIALAVPAVCYLGYKIYSRKATSLKSQKDQSES